MGLCDVPGVNEVCNQATAATTSAVEGSFTWLATAMGELAKAVFEMTWKVLDDTTYVDVTSSGYTRVYNLIFGIALLIMIGFFLLQVMAAMIRREPAGLSRAALGLAKSILGSFLALALVGTALEVTDRLCIGIVHATGTNMSELGDRIAVLVAVGTVAGVANPGAATLASVFLTSLAVGATFFIWISLLVRKALLLVAIVFAPVALAGSSWDHARAWAGRWASFVIALILSKVVVVVIFLVASTQVSAPIDADLKSLSEPLSGIVLLLMAGFAPYIAYKAISFIGFDMYHAMSAEQEAKNALNRPVPLPARAPRTQPRKVLDEGGGEEGSSTPPATHSPKPGSSLTVVEEPTTEMATAPEAAAPETSAAVAGPAPAAALGAELVKSSATAGQQTGQTIGGAADEQATAGDPPPPPRVPMPHTADPTPGDQR
ncbi:conjugal transfer protein TrbL [Nocardioides sp. NPDC127503]|uniref:conjugal transfer protein TrbL n=1 Tax=Nocardioides sp. NPDC127503 TaxID=3154516 RepID=UPI0033330DD7